MSLFDENRYIFLLSESHMDDLARKLFLHQLDQATTVLVPDYYFVVQSSSITTY